MWMILYVIWKWTSLNKQTDINITLQTRLELCNWEISFGFAFTVWGHFNSVMVMVLKF